MGGTGSGRKKANNFSSQGSAFNTVSNHLASSGNEVLVVPNLSGDHSKGKVNTTPVNDTDIANKKYVDDALHAESHTIVSHSDTTATGAELDTLTGGGDTTLHDHDGISENTASRHNESHTVASHSDTTATGAELNTLTDDSMADTLHRHSELSASDGTPNPALSVNASGNVGIGTTSPGELLHVEEGSGTDPTFDAPVVAIFQRNAGGGNDAAIDIISGVTGSGTINFGDVDDDNRGHINYNQNTDQFSFRTGATSDRMVIDSSGNVGIGTASPSAKLDIGDATNTYAVDMVIKDSGNAALSITDNTRFLNFWANHGGAVALGSRSNHDFSILTDDTKAITIDTNQNVGVGTTSPSNPLHVVGDMRYQEAGDTNNFGIIQAVSDNFVLASYGTAGSSGGFIFNVNDGGTEAVRILANGNVGIGTGSPDELLQIDGSGATLKISDEDNFAGKILLDVTGGSPRMDLITHGPTAGGGLSFKDSSLNQEWGIQTNAVTTDGLEFIDGASSVVMTLEHGGNVGIGTTNPSAKTHIDQSSTTAAIPVLTLDQADISEEMISFESTIGTGNPIEAVAAKTLTTTHFIKVTLTGGLTRYIPAGTIA
jgi:hypothetical protein